MASDVVKGLEGGKTRFLQQNVPPGNSTAPVKRLTKVEKARLEALSAFGNCPFNSLVVKRESFKSKLNATSKNSALGKDTTRRLTRMQKARLEANEAFKNIKLGQKRKARIEEKKTGMPSVAENTKRRLTRLEKCKLEVQSAFSDVVLGKIEGNKENSGVKRILTANKDTKSVRRDSLEQINKGKRKSISKVSLNRKSTSRRRSSAVMRRRSSTKGKRLTKVQVAHLEALQSFGGQGLDNVWKSHKNIASTCAEKTEPVITEEMETDTRKPLVFSESVAGKDECQMTADSMEVGMVTCDADNTGQQHIDMVDEAVPNDKAAELSFEPHYQLVDRATQVYKPIDNDKETSSEVQVQNDSIYSQCKHYMHGTKGMSPIPAQSLQQSSAQTSNKQISGTTPIEPKTLTRLERARLEALQSFHGQALDQMMKSSSRKMAKYLTPVKHRGTNTEANPTRNTPSQTEDSHCRHHPRPKSSFYSNLGDKSFCDRGALLESSKIVVLTARSLDTPSPNCSPASAVNP